MLPGPRSGGAGCCWRRMRKRVVYTWWCILVFGLCVASLMAIQVTSSWQYVTYLLRPVWDRPPRPWGPIIVHHYAPNMTMDELCPLHGWTKRATPRRVFDAIIFAHEVDLLEIRWRELDPVVSGFLLVESNFTFTGQEKPLLFAANRHRFKFADRRVTYFESAGRNLQRGESPFKLEAQQRDAMTKLMRNPSTGIKSGDLIIMSDVDEIPSRHTIDLLRWCDGIPPVTHLQMANYLYSFEFLVDHGSWRAAANVYVPGSTAYNHMRKSDALLTDAGWHCSFCFRHLREFAFKMKAYSHADRVRGRGMLRLERIQEVVCRGADIFGMLPEEYTFRDLFAKMGAIPHSYSAVHLPQHLLRNAEHFSYLLPGHCVREI